MKRDLRRKRRKEEQNKRRFEAVKNLMSTFTMGTVAVVAAVVLIPASPKAEIIKAVALEDEIVYQVNVTDKESALDLSTLNVVLENQLEFYEQDIELGENSGYFENLKNDTQYRLSVYGNKGFGQERLDTLFITTEEKIGGTILSVENEVVEYYTNYFVNVAINDPESIYSSVTLYYGYYEQYHYEEDESDEEPIIYYSSVPVMNPSETIPIYDIYSYEPFHVYLEGMTDEGPVLLDEIWVTPPFHLYASFYFENATYEEAFFYIYNDMAVGDIVYTVDIYEGKHLVQTDTFSIESDGYEGEEYIVNNLSPGTTYSVICNATFTNPLTLRKETQLVYEGEISTLGDVEDPISDVILQGEASIVSVTPVTFEYAANYLIELYINDPDSTFTSLNLYYGYLEEYSEDTEPTYYSIPLTALVESVELQEIYTIEPIHIYIEGITNEGSIILDEIWVNPPYQLFTSFYPDYINDNSVLFYLYNDTDVDNITYTVYVYSGGILIESDVFYGSLEDFEEVTYLLEDLSPGTTYNIECIASYTNPITLLLEEQKIYDDDITTLEDYTYTYNIDEFIDYFEVTIDLNDPNDYFNYVYYEIYDTSEEYNSYMLSESISFTIDLNNKSATFVIYKQEVMSYRITISMRSSLIYSNKEIIDIINREAE